MMDEEIIDDLASDLHTARVQLREAARHIGELLAWLDPNPLNNAIARNAKRDAAREWLSAYVRAQGGK